MRIFYTGSRETKELGYKKNFPVRLAEVNYDEEKEATLAERTAQLMAIRGYKFDTGVVGWMSLEVDSREEFEAIAKEFRECARCIKNCMKFGF